MKLIKSNYKKKLVILLLLSLGMIIASYDFSSFNFQINNEENTNVEIDFDYQKETPKTSEYQNFDGAGENLNITLHQSLLNTSTIEFLNLDNSNSFKEPFPNFSGYNTSFVNITIDGIYAPNKTLDLEKDIDDVPISYTTPTYAFSFDAPSKCNITEFQVCLTGSSGVANGGVGFQIWNATWTGSVIDPDQNTGLLSHTETVYTTDTKVWHKISVNVQLDPKNTDNATFFIVMWNTNVPTSFPEFNAKSDGVGQYESLVRYMPVASWVSRSYEIASNVSLVLADNTPKPTDIGLKVNDTVVSDDLSGENIGYWILEEEVASASDKLNFAISADWWEVSCNVTNTQINYTKSDLNGNTYFNILSSGDIVQWNVSIPGGLNYFDSNVPDFNTINFTIPANWLANTISVFNGSTEIQASDIIKRLLGGGFREVQILNAGNGSNWFLTANSTNLLTSIDTYISGIALTNVNHSSIVDFNATFSEVIRNGDLNLSVYSPSPQYLNHSKILDVSIFSSSDEFLVSSWDVSLNVNQYGIFKIELSWNNDTAAGLLESYLTIYADTDLIPSLPATSFDASNTFNVTVFFNDTGLDTGIIADTFSYRIEGGPIRTDNIHNIGNGYYNITIDCNDSEFSGYGVKSLEFSANKHYYNNQTKTVQITIYGETEATITYPLNNAIFDSGDTFDLTIFYNDTVKDLGIDGASIEYQLDSGASYKSSNLNPLGSGYYNITIDCNDIDFNGVGIKNIIVNISKQYYYNQSKTVQITIYGETEATITYPLNNAIFDSGDSFDLTIFYNDTVKDLGIDGATIEYKLDSGASYKSSNLNPLGSGYYNITIDCNDIDFNGVGIKNIIVNISKQFYYNQSKTVQITIYGETEATITYPLNNAIFDSGDTFDLTIFYNDTVKDLGIDGATIEYQLDSGASYKSSNLNPLGSGYYNITIDCNDIDFNGYGIKNIMVNISKQFYYNQSKTVQITIYGETEATITYPLNNAIFDSGDTFDLTIFYNDTVKDLGIDGATIEYRLDSGASYKSSNLNPLGSGYYNITIDCNDIDFNGYGIKNIIVNISKQFYYNQSKSITIKILGETSISSQNIPDKLYYTAAETFNISVYFGDTVESLGISGADVDVDVDGTIYNPVIFDNGDGYYNITIDCSNLIFSIYKTFSIRINVSLVNFHNQSIILGTLIVGNETLYVLAPTSGAVFIDGQSFDITVEYNDSIRDVGIDGATIQYSLNGSGYKPDNYNVNYIGEGKYIITINVNDTDFTKYGFVDIVIDVYKQFYENRSTTYTFHRQIRTQITSSESTDLGSIMKGLNVSYTFNYEEFFSSVLIRDANWTQLSSPQGFSAYLQIYGNGTYTMHLDTTNVLVTGSSTDFEFNVYATGNETQIIRLTVNVIVIQTEVIDVSFISEIARNSGLNQSVRFYFNDTTNNLPVLNVITTNIVVKNYATGTPFNDGEFWLFDPYSNGTYILDITMGTRNSGWYTLEINASKFPNYDYSLFNVTFYYRGNYTQLNLISYSYSDPVIALTPIGLGYNFTIFEGSDTTIVLNLTDSEFSDNIVLGVANSYAATYLNLVSSLNGTLSNLFQFTSPNHVGTLTTSLSALIPGRYLINITLSKTNYEDVSFNFNLTVIAKYQTNLTVVFKPTSVNAGDSFRIVVQAEFFNGISWVPLQNAAITMTPIFDGVPSSEVQIKSTNSTGQLFFDITIRSDAIAMNITLELPVEYDHLADSMVISEINIIPPSPNGFTIEELLPFIIIIGAALVAAGGSVGVYRGVIVPKKREKQRILTEVKTIFDDAINLEHILVLYKGTGTCIFFKSYGSEQIDPELIGGFLSAVSSFGKEMATQEALNEISYGDKMLLLADGALIRVALVLGKNASLILRRHLKEFIGIFEKTFNDVLPKWRGQLNHFRNAGTIVDDILNTSIILPHQISYDFSKAKDLKKPHSKEVLKIAQSCCEEAEREFFFVATLLKEVADRTNKDTAEIFMGIKELRDKKILIPIEISAIGEQPVSQQEINLINQKVTSLPNLTSEEKQKLVNDLAQLGPIEREAYLSSLAKQQKIVTAPIKTTIGDLSVENQKAAKKGIKELLKRAKIAQSKKSYMKAVEIYQGAAILASNWELTTEFLKIQETIRKTRIVDLKIKKSNLENEAKSAVKAKKYLEAATKYKYASKMASEIFKLGVTEMTKEVKRLTNKTNEYEKMK